MSGSTGPRVAVIVGAYRRRRYLLGAVRSVLDQTVGRGALEVRVTKDFVDPEIDRTLAEWNVPASVDDDPRIGTWLGRAVAQTSAPWVAFLDDDDAFVPDRIEHLLAVVRDHPAVGFYRNRVSVMDGQDRPVPPGDYRDLEQDATFDASGPVWIPPDGKRGLSRLAFEQTHVTFNSSTMAVRRELLEGEWAAAFARTQLPDLSLFLAGALGPYGIYLDDRRLTQYRVHPDNVTHRRSWLAEAARCHREGADLARSKGAPDIARWLADRAIQYAGQDRNQRIMELIDGGAARHDVFEATLEYFRYLTREPAGRASGRWVWWAEAYGAGYCLSPALLAHFRSKRPGRGLTVTAPPA